jgi:hypothetical protein
MQPISREKTILKTINLTDAFLTDMLLFANVKCVILPLACCSKISDCSVKRAAISVSHILLEDRLTFFTFFPPVRLSR